MMTCKRKAYQKPQSPDNAVPYSITYVRMHVYVCVCVCARICLSPNPEFFNPKKNKHYGKFYIL